VEFIILLQNQVFVCLNRLNIEIAVILMHPTSM